MKTEYSFKSSELEAQLKHFSSKGITELVLHDSVILGDKKRLLHFLKTVEKDAPDLFVSFTVSASVLDNEICSQCRKINCSIDVPFVVEQKPFSKEAPFFDKKFYSKRAVMLNNASLVFGVNLFFADSPFDSFKAFRDRLGFAVAQYPNHINFPQIEDSKVLKTICAGPLFNSEDIQRAKSIAFACRTFYSAGRAVTWFNSVMKALRINPVDFFSDFAEWQRCCNCDMASGFVPENSSHHEIEKMQLAFLQEKFEEKRKSHLFVAVNDIVCMNGALSRLVSDGTEAVLETEYNPEDIFGVESLDIESFVNDVCLEHCTVKLFSNENCEPDFKILEN